MYLPYLYDAIDKIFHKLICWKFHWLYNVSDLSCIPTGARILFMNSTSSLLTISMMNSSPHLASGCLLHQLVLIFWSTFADPERIQGNIRFKQSLDLPFFPYSWKWKKGTPPVVATFQTQPFFTSRIMGKLVDGFNLSEKYARQIGSFPQDSPRRGEKNKSLKPPPRKLAVPSLQNDSCFGTLPFPRWLPWFCPRVDKNWRFYASLRNNS